MRGGAVLFHSNSNVNGIKFHCWHFFYSSKESSMLCFVSRA